VDERDIFNVGNLLKILLQVIGMRDDGSEGSLNGGNANGFLQAEDYANIEIEIDLAKFAQLSDDLRVVTGVDVKGDLDHLAQLMAHVAITVNQGGPTVADKRQKSGQINPLAYKIRIEFSIATVATFARTRSYNINLNGFPREQISKALLMNDWEQLVRIFRESLREALIQDLERKFAETLPVPEPVGINADRQLSAESYWNLRSVADQEFWSAADVLMLIEAYLSPSVDPHLAFRRAAVTGSEWRRLYDWIRREDGLMLWRVKYQSNRK
jgi:hypothetical protein